MCACEPGYTCTQCIGTPFDPHYEADVHEPMDSAAFDGLVSERWEPWTFGEQGWV